MKRLLILTVIISSCSSYASKNVSSPTGEEVFNVLFKSSNFDLKEEPLCSADYTIAEYMSLILSTSYNNKNTSKITSSCSLSKFDSSDNTVLGVWDCNVQVNETNQEFGFISSASIKFSMSLNKTRLLKGSIRCL